MTPSALIATAKKLIQERYCKDGHHSVVAAALVTESGKVFTALNAGTNQPSIATCAEIIAIGMANTDDPDMAIDMIVAVRDREAYVISPCGKCREYIVDYGPPAQSREPADHSLQCIPDTCRTATGYRVVAAADLIPNKYQKRKPACES